MGTYLALLDSLGWAILHSIWQGGLAWLAVLGIRQGFKNASPALRCNLQIGVLLLTFAAFIGTFALYMGLTLSDMPTGGALSSLTMQVLNDPSAVLIPLTSGATDVSVAPAWADWIGTDRLAAATPFIAALWVVGFLFSALRYGFGYAAAQRLRTQGVSIPDQIWVRRFSALCSRAGVSRNVRLLLSNRVSQPLTLGALRPVVLVPVGFLTALPPDQIEAILLHELGHIRRYDYALNLVQMAVKTVLFYHPAVHAICRFIDQDREEACDDIAISHGPDGSVLARGLATLKMIQSRLQDINLRADGHYAMAALGKDQASKGRFVKTPFGKAALDNDHASPLMRRLSRLAGKSDAVRPEPIMMSALTAMLLGSVYLAAPTGARAHPHQIDGWPIIVDVSEPPEAPEYGPGYPDVTTPDVMAPSFNPPNADLAGGPIAPLPTPAPIPNFAINPVAAPNLTLSVSGPAPSMPPQPPISVPTFTIDQRKLDKAIADNDKLLNAMNRDINIYVQKIAKLSHSGELDHETLEALTDKIENVTEHYEDKIEARQDKLEDEIDSMADVWERTVEARFRDANEAQIEAYEAEIERWANSLAAQVESQVSQFDHYGERASEWADNIASDYAERYSAEYSAQYAKQYAAQYAEQSQRQAEQAQRAVDMQARAQERAQEQQQRAKEQQKRAKEQQKRAMKAQERAREQQLRAHEQHARQKEQHLRAQENHKRVAEQAARTADRQRVAAQAREKDFEAFRSNVLSSLKRDGLIRDKDETVKLTHINDTMSINGASMPKAVRGKYCKMIDELGFTDHATEITIAKNSMHITTGDGHSHSQSVTITETETKK